ncbi:MAG: response regulator transcription factor [Candidatus Aminicenantes bacterium]|nr:response regulator transcription factor [Candidatus Aminicenantes bacterium]
MAKDKILVVDDEKDIIELIRYNLEKEGLKVITATSGEEAIRRSLNENPQLIVLDLMLPGIDGLEVCRILKRETKTSSIPIVMLTVKSDETDIVVGLELGADDYITKPFSPRILAARVKAILRRKEPKEEKAEIIKIGPLTINLAKYQVSLKNKPLSLTSTEFKILAFLAQNKGKVFTRDQLLDKAWKEESFVVDRTVDVHIRRLRQKLGPASYLIETIRGVGYKFKD